MLTFGFLVVVIGLSSLWRAFSGGVFTAQALKVASHHVGGVLPAVLGDLFLF